jgi:predicted dehydrogenase
MKEIRFGVIGCGGIGRWHSKIVRSLPGAVLEGVTDLDASARADAARSFGAKELESAEALVAQKAIDVVCICTPPTTHAELIESAAASGKHVLVEKPLASSLAEADRAVAACASHGVHLGVVHQQRARSATRAVHRLITEGALGKPVAAAAIHTWFKTPEELARDTWRGEAATGGGVLFDQAVHAIDLLVWYLGEPLWVNGATSSAAHDGTGEDTAVATIGFADPVAATLAASTAANLMRDDIAIELAGTRGGLRLEIRDYDHAEILRLDLAGSEDRRARAWSDSEIEALVRTEGGSWREGPRSPLWRAAARLAGVERGRHPFRSPRAYLRRQADRAAQQEHAEPQGHAAVIERMAAAARGEGAPLVTGEDARASIAIVEAIHRSASTGGSRIELSGPERN